MKHQLTKTLIIICLSTLGMLTAQAADLSEDFSSLPKAKYGSNSAVTLSLPSGDWEALKMELKESSGVKQFTFSNGTSSYLITPALDEPGKISVDWGTGGNNKLKSGQFDSDIEDSDLALGYKNDPPAMTPPRPGRFFD